MSTMIVEVSTVSKIEPHKGADSLELLTVRGWQVIARIGVFKEGDKVIFFPPDSCLSQKLTDEFGITKYCSPWKEHTDDLGRPFLRIKAARLRGEASFGTIIPCPDYSWEIGKDVQEYYGAVKYEPPVRFTAGDASPMPEAFLPYTDMENIRNFPDIFPTTCNCWVSEKLHGSNFSVSYMPDTSSIGDGSWTFMARSKTVRRKEFDLSGNKSRYWEPMTESMKKLLVHLSCNETHPVIVYGEILGTGIQNCTYGCVNERKFRIFDIRVNGNFLNYEDMVSVVKLFPDLEMVPVLYVGPFSLAKVKELTDGDTTMCDPSKIKGFRGREGVVVKPVIEQEIPRFGRLCLKSVSVAYLERNAESEVGE